LTRFSKKSVILDAFKVGWVELPTFPEVRPRGCELSSGPSVSEAMSLIGRSPFNLMLAEGFCGCRGRVGKIKSERKRKILDRKALLSRERTSSTRNVERGKERIGKAWE